VDGDQVSKDDGRTVFIKALVVEASAVGRRVFRFWQARVSIAPSKSKVGQAASDPSI
jgi:hypothetical protein